MPHFMTVLIYSKPFLDDKMSVFEENGAFNNLIKQYLKLATVLTVIYMCLHVSVHLSFKDLPCLPQGLGQRGLSKQCRSRSFSAECGI